MVKNIRKTEYMYIWMDGIKRYIKRASKEPIVPGITGEKPTPIPVAIVRIKYFVKDLDLPKIIIGQ